MTELPIPVKQALRTIVSEQSVARMWSRIDARGRVARTPDRRWLWAAAAIGVAATIALVIPRSAPREATVLAPMHPVVDQVTVLDDGSWLAVAASSDVEPVETSATAVVVQQVRGAVTYGTAPERRWTIECGAVSVVVVGSVLRVARDEHYLRIDVVRGTVFVRGDRVPDHLLRLGPGMHVEIAGDAPRATAPPPPAPAPPPAPPPPRTPAARPASWRELAAHGANDAAYAQLGHGGVASAARTASVDELFALADVARLSGHAVEAVAPLRRIVERYPDDARATLAWLTLGRLQLRSLGAPGDAARSLEAALAHVPADLAEDASALHVEALGRAGELAAARDAYATFVERFPHSAHIAELRTWATER